MYKSFSSQIEEQKVELLAAEGNKIILSVAQKKNSKITSQQTTITKINKQNSFQPESKSKMKTFYTLCFHAAAFYFCNEEVKRIQNCKEVLMNLVHIQSLTRIMQTQKMLHVHVFTTL